MTSADGSVSRDSDELLLRLAAQEAEIKALRGDNRRLLAEVERAHLVTGNVPALIAYWDHEERCRFANQPYLEWFGYTPEALLGTPMKELLGEALYQKNELYIRRALAGVPQHFERDLIRKLQGDLRHTQTSYVPDVKDGQVRGFFVLVVDVTERKRAEMNAIEASKQATAASRLKSRFLANVSHEIRTPLNGMIGTLDLASQMATDPHQRELLDAASGAANQLLTVFSDILDISKIEVGALTLVNAPFEIRSVIESGLAAPIARARKKGLEVSLSIDPGVPRWVDGDAGRVLQVLLNVFTNAANFTKSGSIRVRVAPDAGAADLVVIEVADTGIGIRQEDIAVIFTPFRQVDDSNTRAVGGAGLGLAICAEITRMMGGGIDVKSRFGEGSVFRATVRLPAAAESPPADALGAGASAAPACAPEAPCERRLRVLLAEDDELNAMITTRFLRRLDCDVVHVVDGAAAVREIGRAAFDLILMDMQMPVMDGLAATRLIRGRESGSEPRVRIVALTANATMDDKRACANAGMDGFLTKPIQRERIVDLLRSCRER